ncbi:SseB family protein [Roseovarius sp. EL26]|uniref:SseB family protein n=1 Tax=Roseovarius sp. EL26 TaxID=2126672 RepID=UPI000EA18082|nr:SseB family protein [Roseovarius sp. EL26]
MPDTPLDHAFAAMQAAPDNAQAELRYFEHLAGSELFLLLTEEPEGDNISPDLFEVEGTGFALTFDQPERLAGFVGREAPYAALSGRALINMLAGQGIGMGVNLGIEDAQNLLEPAALAWLQQMLPDTPDEITRRPVQFETPAGLPENVLTALDTRLSHAAGLAESAYISKATYDSGEQGFFVGFTGAPIAAQSALAQMIAEVLAFSGLEAAAMDVGFLRANDPAVQTLAAQALRIDLPTPEEPQALTPTAPGRDPDRPPKLR